jgi:hypothetical protein
MVQPINSDNINQIKTKTSKATNKVLEAIEIEVIVLFFVILIVLLVLNYFSILPLSQKFPKIFGFLPTKSENIIVVSNSGSISNNNLSTPSAPEEFKFLFSCPVVSVCAEMKQIYDKSDQKVRGEGFVYIEDKTPVQAIIDGTITSVTEKDSIVTIIEKSEDESFEITYIFTGKQESKIKNGTKVKNFEIIANIAGSPTKLSEYSGQNYSMIFQIKDLRTDQILPVEAVEKGNGLQFL